MNELIKEIIVKFENKSELSFFYDRELDNFLVQELDPNTLQYSKGIELGTLDALELLNHKVKTNC